MRFCIVILICVLSQLTSLAQFSALVIDSDKDVNTPFTLYLNEVKQNEIPCTSLKLEKLPFEVYAAKLVYTENMGLKKTIFLRLGKTKNYLLTKADNKLVLVEGVYSALSDTKANATTLLFKSINDDSLRIAESALNDLASKLYQPSLFDEEEPDNQAENTAQKIEPQKETPTEEPTALSASPRLKINSDSLFKSLRMRNPETVIVREPCSAILGNDDLRLLKQKIKDIPELQSKQINAATALQKTCFKCGQLKEIMRLLDGDDLKIELYKKVYFNISDFYNRSELYDLFFFDTSVEELKKMQ